MSESEWERQSRIKEEAWRWASERLRLEVTVEEVDGDLSEEQLQKLQHVRTVICKTLDRQGLRIARNRRKRFGATLAEVFAAESKESG